MVVHTCSRCKYNGEVIMTIGGYNDIPEKSYIIKGVNKGEIYSVVDNPNDKRCPYCDVSLPSSSSDVEVRGVLTNTETMKAITSLEKAIKELRVHEETIKTKEAIEAVAKRHGLYDKDILSEIKTEIEDSTKSICDGDCVNCEDRICEYSEVNKIVEPHKAMVDYETLKALTEDFVQSFSSVKEYEKLCTGSDLRISPEVNRWLDNLYGILDTNFSESVEVRYYYDMLLRAMLKVGVKNIGKKDT